MLYVFHRNAIASISVQPVHSNDLSAVKRFLVGAQGDGAQDYSGPERGLDDSDDVSLYHSISTVVLRNDSRHVPFMAVQNDEVVAVAMISRDTCDLNNGFEISERECQSACTLTHYRGVPIPREMPNVMMREISRYENVSMMVYIDDNDSDTVCRPWNVLEHLS